MSESQALASELRAKFAAGDVRVIEDIKREVDRYSWYHKIEVIPGMLTPGMDWTELHVNRIITAMHGFDFAGKRVLDIGCRDGAISFAAERMGASEVLGIDNNPSEGLTNFLIPFRDSKIRAIELNVNDLTRDKVGEFDIVMLPGVLYHLRYPMWALRRISDILKDGGNLIVEGGFVEGFGDLPILFCPLGSDSPYEPTSVSFFNDAGIVDTLLSMGFSDVRRVDAFAHDWLGGKRNRKRWVKERFPKFFRRMWWREELEICRKIFTCTKRWSLDERVQPSKQQYTLEQYWDGDHRNHTDEARSAIVFDRASIERAYRAGVGRMPDEGSVLHFLRQHKNIHEFASALFLMSEFKARFPKGSSDHEFLVLLYRNVLNRGPDPDAMAIWEASLKNKLVSRETVFLGFSESDENKNGLTANGVHSRARS